MRLLSRSRASAAAAGLLLALACLACGAGADRSGDGGFDDAPALAALEGPDGGAALALAFEAIERADAHAAPHELAARVETLALRFFDAGHAEASESLFLRALALHEREPRRDLPGTARSLHYLSSLAFNRVDYSGAESYERRAIALLERSVAPDDPQLAASRRDLGFVFLTQGRLAEAEPWLVEAWRTLERAGPAADFLEIALARDYLATLRLMQGDYSAAEALYERLVPEANERLGENDPQALFFVNNLAGIYRDEERYDRAEPLLYRSLELRRAANPVDPGAVARATLNLAELYRLQGKPQDAEPRYVEALRLAREAYPEHSGERLEFVNQLAVLLREQGRLDEAEPLAREALELAREALGGEHPRVAQSELDLAELLRARGRCDEALGHGDRAVEIRERVFGARHPEVALALTTRAGCLVTLPPRARDARHDLDRAIAILAGSSAYPGSAADALALRAGLRRSTEPQEAKADLAAALDAVEALRPRRGGGEAVRAEFLGRRAELYERLARWEVEDGNPAHGLLAAERGRGRALLDQLAAASVGEGAAGDPESAAALAASRAQVAECRARIAFVEGRGDLPADERARELAALAARLERASGEFRSAYDRFRNASPAWRAAVAASADSLERIQAEAVPPDGLLLFFSTGAEASLLFVVPPAPGAVEAFPLSVGRDAARALGVEAGSLRRDALDRIVLGRGGVLAGLTAPAAGSSTTLRGIGGIATAPAAGLDPRLAALYDVLVPEPLRPRLTRSSEVVVVPDGPLLALPLEALIVAPGADARSARFWLDDGPPLRYAPSATFLIRLREATARRAAGAGALSVSDPAYGEPGDSSTGAERGISASFDPRRLPRLPGTARETQAVRRALDGMAQVETLDGERAREPAVRRALAGKRFLHLATHGLADRGGNELFAALALTPPPAAETTPEDDGLLELHEIYELRLAAELAVLSACGSNTGRAVAGEGVFALSRGFLVAGAERVVASQWPVDDDASAALVGQLFSGLASVERGGGHARVAAALAEAKRSVRRQPGWEHPFFWAAFVLSGLG